MVGEAVAVRVAPSCALGCLVDDGVELRLKEGNDASHVGDDGC